VTILAWVYIVVGTIGFVYHFSNFAMRHAFDRDVILVEFTELSAIAAGAFMLRGHNWARWLAVLWMAFHVVLSAFDAFYAVAIHSLFLAVIAWFLFRPPAAFYFRAPR
jgi:hypothetical protein